MSTYSDSGLRRIAQKHQDEGSRVASLAREILGDKKVMIGENGNYSMQGADSIAADIEENSWKRSMRVFFDEDEVERAAYLTGRR